MLGIGGGTGAGIGIGIPAIMAGMAAGGGLIPGTTITAGTIGAGRVLLVRAVPGTVQVGTAAGILPVRPIMRKPVLRAGVFGPADATIAMQ